MVWLIVAALTLLTDGSQPMKLSEAKRPSFAVFVQNVSAPVGLGLIDISRLSFTSTELVVDANSDTDKKRSRNLRQRLTGKQVEATPNDLGRTINLSLHRLSRPKRNARHDLLCTLPRRKFVELCKGLLGASGRVGQFGDKGSNLYVWVNNRWGRSDVFNTVSNAETHRAVENRNSDSVKLDLRPWSLLGDSNIDGSRSRIGGFASGYGSRARLAQGLASGVQRPLDEPERYGGQARREGRNENHPQGPFGHALLSAQVILGALVFAGGLYLFGYAFHHSARLSTSAGPIYAFSGALATILGAVSCLHGALSLIG